MGDASIKAGSGAPLGATVHADGVNFSVFSKNATQIELLLFDDGNAARPARVIALDPEQHRTYHYWHVVRAGPRTRAGLRLPGARAVRAGTRIALRRRQGAARSRTASRSLSPTATTAMPPRGPATTPRPP